MSAKNLGKLRAVGSSFKTTTNKQYRNDRNRRWVNRNNPRIVVMRPGDRDHFTCGKRRYFCEVVALVETRTGYYAHVDILEQFPTRKGSINNGRRWWVFTYLVRIIEN